MGTKKGRRDIRKNNGRTKKRAIRRPLNKRKEGKKTIRKHKGHKGKNTTRRKRLSVGGKLHRPSTPDNFGGRTPTKQYIYNAIYHYDKLTDDDIEILTTFLKNKKSDEGKMFHDNIDGNTPLHLAVENGLDIDIITLLASGKGGENAKGMQNKYDGNTPLHLAVIYENEKKLDKNIITLLASEKAKITINDYGNTPLHIAVEKGSSPDIITLLASENAKSMKNNSGGNTPLHLAVLKKKLDIDIITLLASGPEGEKAKSTQNIQIIYEDDDKVTEYSINTPLHLAVIYTSDPNIIKILASGIGGEKAKTMMNLKKTHLIDQVMEERLTPYDFEKRINPSTSEEILNLLNPNASVKVDEPSLENEASVKVDEPSPENESVEVVETPPEDEKPNTVEDEEYGFEPEFDDEELG